MPDSDFLSYVMSLSFAADRPEKTLNSGRSGDPEQTAPSAASEGAV